MSAAIPRDALVAVIGAGAMGSGIAQVAARAGHRVRLFDTRIGAAERARDAIGQTLAGLATKGRVDASEASAAAARITPIHALPDCVGASLVVEAIIEDLEAKRALLRELEVFLTPAAILASNTSSLSITSLAAGMKAPGRIVGMHFFNPVPLMQLVEVVSGLATDPAAAATIHATALAWGKSPVHVTSTPGFIVNRCARPYYGEALRLLAERAADAATLDALLRESGGFRMGPFELMDLIGNDVNFAVTRSVWEAHFHDPRYAPSLLQQERVTAGYLGRKSGRGFFDYTPGVERPAARSEAPAAPPIGVVVRGDLGIASPLVERLAAAGIAIERSSADPAFPDGALEAQGVWLALSDGRTATGRAGAVGRPNLVVFDLALDYAHCTRLAVAAADGCDEAARATGIGALQAAGIAVSRLDDVAGLAILRTVVMLANEAADAVTTGVASADDVDTAMCKGVNYPRGPLAWAEAIGIARVQTILRNLAAHYGEDRYRVAPLIARRCARPGAVP